MNLAQLENIKLRLAAVRGRPWSISKGANGKLFIGPKADYKSQRDVDFWSTVDSHVDFCDSCLKRVSAGRAKADAALARGAHATVDVVGSAEGLFCQECKKKTYAVAQIMLASFMASTADADECQWLVKAPEDEEALIFAVEGYMDKCQRLEVELAAARDIIATTKAKEASAVEDLRKLRASLATLKSMLADP